MIRTAIITVSSTRSPDNDASGNDIKGMLGAADYHIMEQEIVPDDIETIRRRLVYLCDELKMDLIITSGGTGVGPADVTPEATAGVIDKHLPGFSELMRYEGIKKTKRAALSRGITGMRKNTLIMNLPGSPAGARESLMAVMDIIPHCMDMISGKGH